MKLLTIIGLIALSAAVHLDARAQTIQLGETTQLGTATNSGANLLLGNAPYALTQSAKIQSLSLYVTRASGHLRLGIYDSGPNNNCAGGTLKAQTDSFTPVGNKWNTANVVTQVQLLAGNYCLVALPSSDSLGYVEGMATGVNDYCANFTFGSMPSTFPSTLFCMDGYHLSLYATLTSVVTPTLSLSFNPPSPSVPANTPPGTVITAISATWSNNQPFTGTLSCANIPYFCDGGTFAIDGSNNLIISTSGPGVAGDGGTVQNVTVTATQ
jgi:hypothetical protein